MIATERLYYADSYRTDFEATVSDVTEFAGRPALVLDQTCFYPTSGGQPYDKGLLEGFAVADVEAADGVVYHILEQAADSALIGRTVHGEIDWRRRFDHMQQHSGQHLISHVFHDLLAYETVSVHFGDEESTLDLTTPEVSAEQLTQVEQRVNQLVFQAIPIKSYFVGDNEIDNVPLRRPPKVSGMIRIVEIADSDWSACGGTHTRTTAEIGPVKFIRQQRMRGQARITFLCGQRALDDYVRKHELITSAAALYDTEIGQVPALVARDMERLRELQHKIDELQAYQLAAVAQDMLRDAEGTSERRIIAQACQDMDVNAVKTLASLLIENAGVVALLASAHEDKATVIFARAEDVQLHAGNLLRSTLSQFGGGGGGRADFAQGGGVSVEHIHDLLAYAAAQVRTELDNAS